MNRLLCAFIIVCTLMTSNIFIHKSDIMAYNEPMEIEVTDEMLHDKMSKVMIFYSRSPRVWIGSDTVMIDDTNSDVMPIIKSGTIMLPAEFMANALNLICTTCDTQITLSENDNSIIFTSGSSMCILNGVDTKLSESPFVLYNHLYIPVADVCSAFGRSYELDASGIAIVGLNRSETNNFDWNDKTDFTALNGALRDVIYESPTPTEVIEDLKSHNPSNEHPRLMLDADKVSVLRERVASREPYKTWMQSVMDDAEEYLEAEPLEYILEDGGIRLLYTSRKALLYIETLSFAYQMTRDTKYADGAIAVMMRVCDTEYFPDWHPYHFLDVAEMSAAVAIGYDWCYDRMTLSQKNQVKNALVENALKPVMEDYNEVPGRVRTWYWSSPSSASYPQNWVAVCFGGTAMAALAIGDEDLGDFTEAGNVITEGMKRVQDWQECYMPDGACPDGTGYWEFAMSYMVFGTDSMRTALGTEYGMMDSPGMKRTFTWLSQLMGPAGAFNYDSNNDSFTDSPEYFWYSAKLGNSALANYRLDKHLSEWGKSATYKDILWYEPVNNVSHEKLDLDFASRGNVGMTVLRSGFDNTDTWASLFGGYMNKKVDSTQDFDGSFVMDMLGTRFAMDLGSEWQTYVDLETPRSSYYRIRPEGHNTVIINPDADRAHNPSVYGKQLNFESNELSAYTIYDFTDQIKDKGASKWNRGMYLDRETESLMIQDELISDRDTEYYWFMHTEADIEISGDGRSATLTKDGKQIKAYLISEDDSLKFTRMNAEPLDSSPNPPAQSVNDGVQKLTVHKLNAASVNMAVKFIPVINGEETDDTTGFTEMQNWNLKLESAGIPPQMAENPNVFLNKDISVNIPSRDLLRDYMIVDGSYGDKTLTVNDRYASAASAAVKPLEITIDLGRVYKLSELKIVERWLKSYNTNYNGVGCFDKVKVETGITAYGVTKYSESANVVDVSHGTYDNQAVITTIPIDEAYADKVRITLDRTMKPYIQYEIWEIEGIGEKVVSEDILKVHRVEFTKDGVVSDTMPTDGDFIAKVYHNALTPAEVVFALYNADGELIACSTGITEEAVEIDVPDNETVAEAKIFSLSSLTSLFPLAKVWEYAVPVPST